MEQKEAMIIEEESSINLQGPEMVGNLADIWTNLNKFEEFRVKTTDDVKNFMPPFTDIDKYEKLGIFPLNTNPYTTTLLNYAV